MLPSSGAARLRKSTDVAQYRVKLRLQCVIVAVISH